MKCLYETLQLDRQATDEEIKKAYRKQALIWHPDKNQHRKEQAENEFKAIQNAYEILSDKHERSWYDSHRDAILKSGSHHQAGGGSGMEATEKPEEDFNIYMYYSANCHTGHHDGTKGFYAVYSRIFKDIAESEIQAYELHSDPDTSDPPGPFPDFGLSASDKKTLMAFHSFWANFVTVKSFAWADEYNPASAPNRRVRRAMEEENKKARKVARKEFIEEIRHFAAFVKKRDKRVMKFQKEEEERKAAKKKQAEELREKQLEERRRRAQEYEDPNWVAAEAEGSDGSDGSVEEVVQYVCVVCDKTFRSSKALENHERSKKHREQLVILRRALEAENEVDPDSNETPRSQNSDQGSSSQAEERSTFQNLGKKKKKKIKQKRGFAVPKVEESTSDCLEPSSLGNGRVHESQEGTFTAFSIPNDPASSGHSCSEQNDLDDEEDILARLVAQQGASAGAQNQSSAESDGGNSSMDPPKRECSEEPESAAGCDQDKDAEQVVEGLMGDEARCANASPRDEHPGCAQQSEETGPHPIRSSEPDGENMTGGDHRQGRKSRRKGKQKNMVDETPDSIKPVMGKQKTKKNKGRGKGDGKEDIGEGSQETLKCQTCSEEFTSRNQMFKHIKKTNHAVWK